MAIRILIAENDTTTREQLRADLASDDQIEIAGLARDGQEALQLAHTLRPDIALLDVNLGVYNGFQTAEFLAAAEGLSTISILLSHTDSPDMLRNAMRAGARDYLAYPVTRERLLHAIHENYAEMERRQSSQFAEAADPNKSTRIFVVGGAKGGIGKTTITTNLAVALAQESKEPTALVDMYTQFGDISMLLNIKPRRTLVDLLDLAPEALDAQILEDCMEQHESGIRVLVTSLMPVALDALVPTFIDRVLRLLKDKYRYIVMDVPPILHSGTLHAYSYASGVLLIANRNEITTINDTRQLLDTLDGKYVARENIHIVMNRLAVGDRMEIADIERALNCTVAAHLPNEGLIVSDSINTGVPFMLSNPDSLVAHSMRMLAHRMMGNKVNTFLETAPQQQVRGWGGMRGSIHGCQQEQEARPAPGGWRSLIGGLFGRGNSDKRKQAA